MKTLYIDCGMGAAGDMLMSALLELHPEPGAFIEKMNSIRLPKVKISRKTDVKCGITGTHIDVTVGGVREDEHMHGHSHSHSHSHEHSHSREHTHMSMNGIRNIVSGLDIPESVKSDILNIYTIIAEAESTAHGRPVEAVHFHEVGTMDAVADITGVCLLLHELKPEKIIASPVRTGSGTVRCAHGVLPVPAPATAYILKGIPTYGGNIRGELCTPTGAALLKYFADEFGDMPVMKTEKIGYGMGTKDFEAANCVRMMLGETDEESTDVYELCCNIDDMTGEELGFACDMLMKSGALDVFTVPVGMKKGRPGTLLVCICGREQRDSLTKAIFGYTSTLGVREHICRRRVMARREETIETPYGSVRIKRSEGFGTAGQKAEYDDIAKIAEEKSLSLKAAKALLGVE